MQNLPIFFIKIKLKIGTFPHALVPGSSLTSGYKSFVYYNQGRKCPKGFYSRKCNLVTDVIHQTFKTMRISFVQSTSFHSVVQELAKSHFVYDVVAS